MSTVRDMHPGQSMWVKAHDIGLEPAKGRCRLSLDAETFSNTEDVRDVVVYRFSQAMVEQVPTPPHWTCVGPQLPDLYTLDLTDGDVVEAHMNLLPLISLEEGVLQ